MTDRKAAAAPLFKQKSWSPDTFREEAWQRRRDIQKSRGRRSRSVTDEDLNELKACIELGFGFDSPELDQKLSDTLPALGLFHAVNKNYNDSLTRSPLFCSSSSSSSSCCSLSCDGSSSPIGSPHRIVSLGDDPKVVKTKLKQWAQVVACSVRQSKSADFKLT